MRKTKGGPWALGVDPGVSGAFVLTDGETLKTWPMPVCTDGKDKSIDFDGVHELLDSITHGGQLQFHVYLERAVPMAQGMKSAFNYGKGFAALEIAISLLKLPVTYVEPNKWTKEMHEGISTDLKSKAKSLIAVKRLFPKLVRQLPTNTKGRLLDGPIDALLIAAYGLRSGSVKTAKADIEDFY